MGIKNKVLISIFTLLLFGSSTRVLAGDACSVRLRQASVLKNTLKVYLDVLDETDEPIRNLELKDLKVSATIGQNQAVVSKILPFNKAGEGVAYIFLVDISKSLTEQEFSQMSQALDTWIGSMGGKDRAAIITFGETVRIEQDFTGDSSLLKRTVTGLRITDNKTQLHRGLAKAIEIGNRFDQGLPTRRVIITMSDGREDFTGGMLKQEVINTLNEQRIPIYALGFYHPPLNQEKQGYLDSLGEIARVSGGEYFQIGTSSMAEIYDKARKRILSSYVVTCNGFKADGRVYRLNINVIKGSKSFGDGFDLRLTSLSIPSEIPWWVYLSGLFLIVILIIIFVLIIRSKRKAPPGLQEDKSVSAPEELKAIKGEVATPQPKGKKLRIAVMGNFERQKPLEISLAPKLIIGRVKPGSDLVFEDREISAKHCEVFLEGGKVYIRDLKSTNGTSVNGVPINERYRLSSGDVVMIGRTEFRVIFDEES